MFKGLIEMGVMCSPSIQFLSKISKLFLIFIGEVVIYLTDILNFLFLVNSTG